MSLIAVEVASLTTIARELDEAGERLHGMATRLRDATAEQTGHRGLALALDQFERHWDAGLEAVASEADRAGDQLAEAVRVYNHVEAAISRAAAPDAAAPGAGG
ncbi:MAG: hypothetical protein JWN88_3028 [Frankiales bacterium]|jgi:hypothetical protein|nr:hypothetical protein [Frankiales bacterium]